MNKLLLAIMISVSLSALADDKCTPNLVNEDMCVAAKIFADNGKKSVPVHISERVTINKFRAEKKTGNHHGKL